LERSELHDHRNEVADTSFDAAYPIHLSASGVALAALPPLARCAWRTVIHCVSPYPARAGRAACRRASRPMETTTVLEAAQAQVESFLSDLAQLVNIDSGTYTPAGVARVSDALQWRFEASGALVERVDGKQYGPHLVARWPGAGKGRILLIGHMDTVFPEGEVAQRPFRVEEGRAYGPGVMDMKSGLLVGVYAARLLRDEAPWAELVMLCN